MLMRVKPYGVQRMSKNNRANGGKLRRNETKHVQFDSYFCILNKCWHYYE